MMLSVAGINYCLFKESISCYSQRFCNSTITRPLSKNRNRNKSKFIDWIRLKVTGGRGGNGCVSFRREAHVRFGGPNGGNGGRGGSVILIANSRIKTLGSLVHHHKADSGRHGEGNDRDGRHGDDKIIQVPVGTVIKSEGNIIADLSHDQQRYIAAKGGEGGVGNMNFATPTHSIPREYTEGSEGQEAILELELKTIADIGLVGFPNAGKSTLLHCLSRACPKIACYPFTTLTPQVGVVEGLGLHHITVADIPGLLPGAHNNYGLGHSFLRHIERCSVLVYVLDSQEERERSLHEQLQTLQQELQLYNQSLLEKGRLIVVNKMDTSNSEDKIIELKDKGIVLPIIPVSGLYKWNIHQLKLAMSLLLTDNSKDSNNDNNDDKLITNIL